jgi:hypothetical protein
MAATGITIERTAKGNPAFAAEKKFVKCDINSFWQE